MKKLMPLILLLRMGFSSFSQSLTPKVIPQNEDTLFCFTIPQSKIIAKHLENSIYCDSVLMQTESQVKLLYQLQTVNDSLVYVLKMKTENQQSIIANQDEVISNLHSDLKQSENKLRSQRWQKIILAAGTALIAVLTVFK